jgi:hypothetical protein
MEAAVAAPSMAAEPAELRAGGTKVEAKRLEVTKMAAMTKQPASALLFVMSNLQQIALQID